MTWLADRFAEPTTRNVALAVLVYLETIVSSSAPFDWRRLADVVLIALIAALTPERPNPGAPK